MSVWYTFECKIHENFKMTKSKRIQVTLTDEVFKQIEELAAVSGTSRSGIVSEMMTLVAPQLQELTKALLLAKKRNLDSFDVLENALMSSINEASQLGLEMKQEKRKWRTKQDDMS